MKHGWFSYLFISTVKTWCPDPFIQSLSPSALPFSLLVPPAGAVQRLLEVVLHNGGVARAVECDGTGLQSTLAAALTESGVTVDVEVEYGGRRTLAITREHRNL